MLSIPASKLFKKSQSGNRTQEQATKLVRSFDLSRRKRQEELQGTFRYSLNVRTTTASGLPVVVSLTVAKVTKVSHMPSLAGYSP